VILKKDGFTLIEILIGLIILSIGLLAIAGLLITSTKSNFGSKNLTQATYVVQDRLESLKNLPFTDPLLSAGNHNYTPLTLQGITYNRTYTIADNPAGYKWITYTVTWNDGVDHSISFSTIRSQ